MANGELTLTVDEKDLFKIQQALSQVSELESNAIIQKGLQESVALFKKSGKQELSATLIKTPHNVKMAAYMAKKRGGGLIKSFSTKTKKRQAKGYAGFTKLGHHSHLVSNGTKDRYTKKGYYRGSVRGSRFWKINFEKTKGQASKTLMDSITMSINKIINRNR